LVILISIAVIVVIGTLVPQQADLGKQEYEAWCSRNPTFAFLFETLGFTHIYSSWWFIIILSFLLSSLVTCGYAQFKTAYKFLRTSFRATKNLGNNLPHGVTLSRVSRSKILKKVQSELHRRRFKVIHKAYGDEIILRARRFYFAWLGTFLFHMGLILILLGGLISVATRAEGYIELGEGQIFTERRDNYQRLETGPLFGANHKNFQIRLDSFKDEYWPDGALRRAQSKVSIIDGGRMVGERIIEVSDPLKYRGVTFYQSPSYFGYAPKLTLEVPGRPESAGLVHFPPSEEKGQGVETTIYPPGTEYEIEAQLFYGEKPPSMRIHVFEKGEGTESRKNFYTGVLKLGEKVEFGEVSLRFDDLVRWSGFTVVQDKGVGIIIYSFYFAAVCLLMIILLPPQELIFCIRENGDKLLVRAGGRGRRSRLPWGAESETVAQDILSTLERRTF
ncbi:MAG: cytochrome c biogenesis protein ResB, partial [Candidatus Subteraquimicrobiales bacterium]|nr:cytochrome c biogenesis protein ResB [Candidatus Subteraquimicrobiales bacterium]